MMTTRHRTTSSSRKDPFWRPSDSDSDRPRRTMATTQRHNVDHTGPGAAEAPRKHHVSRRVEPTDLLDPSATYSRHHKSSKDRSSTVPQPSSYVVPPSPQYQTRDAYYDLRSYRKGKTTKRSPRSSANQVLPSDEVKVPRSGHHSRHTHSTTAALTQLVAPTHAYPNPSAHAARDPTSSSRHHRSRDKDREKTSRDIVGTKTRDTAVEQNQDRETRHRRDNEGERSSKDKERRREKDRHKERQAGVAAEVHPIEATMYRTYVQGTGAAQRSTDKIPASHPESNRAPLPQTQPTARAAVAPSVSVPWTGLTSTGRGAAAPVPDPAYPYTSDRDDPPLPIPPPERPRERTSSKPRRPHHHRVPSQSAGQDSGISSSEQEQPAMERTRTADRRDVGREQASLLQRGYSSGPSGSENEKERRKHRGESSRHKTKSNGVDPYIPPGPTKSQEIATAWYTRLTRDSSVPKDPVLSVETSKIPNGSHNLTVPPSGKTTSSVGLTASKRSAPHIVSIRAGQGPADPQTSSMLPKIHSGVTPTRQLDPLPPSQPSRPQEISISPYGPGPTMNGYGEVPPGHRLSTFDSVATTTNRHLTQTYQHTYQPRPGDSNILGLGTAQHGLPEVVVRPPSTAPTSTDPYYARAATGSTQPSPSGGQSSGRLHGEARSRSATAPASSGTVQVSGQLLPHPSVGQYGGEDPYRPNNSTHSKVPSHDISSRFPLYEEDATTSSTRLPATGSSASPKRGLTYPGASAHPVSTTVHINPSNYYDRRSSKPPSVTTGTPDANTPIRSPSVRLHPHRNGSNDTIVHAALTKQSPSGSSQQHLPHRTSATNLQPYNPPRHEAVATTRQPSTLPAYPEEIRYRSPASTRYPNANNVSTINQPQIPTNATSYDYQQSRHAAAMQVPSVLQQGQSYVPQQTRTGHSLDYGPRSPDPSQAAFPSTIASAQRVGRSAPSPAPNTRPRLESLTSSSAPRPTGVAPPQPVRNQSYPAPAPNHMPFPTAHAHSRTASDPQYAGKVGHGYASASLPTRGQPAQRDVPAFASNDLLLTPSSLAPSNLPQAPVAPLSRTESKTSSKEKKKGFFGLNLFRSRSSPPKQREMEAPPPSGVVREKRVSQPTQPSPYMQTGNLVSKDAHVPPNMAAASVHQVHPQYHPQASSAHHGSGSAVPIAAPTPIAPGGARSHNGKMFTPFRLLSRRHHTISTASVEAVDGTVINAMLTGGDSTRSSTAGRPSPPLRDPMTAAQEWRNHEEHEQQGRGMLRRRRPGVTFDVGEDVPEDGRPPVQKSMRANMASYQAGVNMSVGPAPLPARQATA